MPSLPPLHGPGAHDHRPPSESRILRRPLGCDRATLLDDPINRRRPKTLKDVSGTTTPSTPPTRASSVADASTTPLSWGQLQTPSRHLAGAAAIATPSSRCSDASSTVFSQQGQGTSRRFGTPSHAGRSWRQGEKIGSGNFGTVYKALDKTTGNIFAVKVSEICDGDEQHQEVIRRELTINKKLRHKHIVSFLGYEYTDQRLFIYLEYVAGGSLRSMLNEFGPLDDALLPKAAKGILEGLNYLHNHDPPVVHRDLKGSNVLVDLNFRVKIADFGCSRCDSNSQSFNSYGSALWMAPEVVCGGHGRKADMWSFGCVFIEMTTAKDPWGPGAFDNLMHALREIGTQDRTPPVPEGLGVSARDFLGHCLQRAPADRFTAADLLDHEFIVDASRLSSRTSKRGDGLRDEFGF